jgi:hypothetical protein
VIEEGDLKKAFLVTRSRANALEFDCHPLNELIKELRTTFSIRYVELPAEAAFERYEERGWLVRTIEKYLDGQEWPDDAAKLNPISKKRKREEKKQKGSKSKRVNNNRSSSKPMK